MCGQSPAFACVMAGQRRSAQPAVKRLSSVHACENAVRARPTRWALLRPSLVVRSLLDRDASEGG